jgi:hypothetical protein
MDASSSGRLVDVTRSCMTPRVVRWQFLYRLFNRRHVAFLEQVIRASGA